MLRKLQLHHVGPATSLDFEPARRINLITGDNGLGKSFLLEAAWWALTRTWHESPAVPSAPDASISFEFDGTSNVHTSTASWNPTAQSWQRTAGRPPNPGLVLYARVDGSYSVWDPARNYRLYTRADGGQAESPSAYQFSSQQVLWGLTRDIVQAGQPHKQTLCKGLIDDWTLWQVSNDPRFEVLVRILSKLGAEGEPLSPGKPLRPSLDDERQIPTIRMPYGQEVPITYAPAGVRQICKLAYLLTWSLTAHRDEAQRMNLPNSSQIIVLIDEPETHLHPRWQRTVLPSLLEAIASWHMQQQPEVQLLVATHSPMVLASMEPVFDPTMDALWKLDLVDGDVQIARDQWHKRGDVNRWLTSDVFDLEAATSRPAQLLLHQAGVLLDANNPDPAQVQAIDAQLGRMLPEMDPFFVRWRYYMRGHLLGEAS